MAILPHDRPFPQRPRHPRPPGPGEIRQALDDGGAAPDADEQPRRRGGGEARASWWSMAASAGPRATGTASRRSSRTLRRLEETQTLLVQSGKPVGVFAHPRRRAARADRQQQPGAALGELGAFLRARSQGADDVRPDDRRVLDLHRQPGHRAGHLRDLRRGRAGSISAASLAGRWILTGGLGGMGGAQPLAGDFAGRLRAGGGMPAVLASRSGWRRNTSTTRPTTSTPRWR